MKILYAIQGTGNGHISRALEIIPKLKEMAEVDVLVSASQWELKLPFEVNYRFHGLGFVFGKKGGIDLLNTYLQIDTSRLMQEIRSLDVDQYDLVISDFEPVSAWACQIRKKVCVGLSNQAVSLHPLAPKPESSDAIGKMILRHYAPVTYNYGFHFKRFDESVYTPIIRQAIRQAEREEKKHITVYLPSYDNERIFSKLKHFGDVTFEIFSKKAKSTFITKNMRFFPLNGVSFVRSMAESAGVITNAGFGTAAEALFLGKKLLVVPMKNQYEQFCNAAVLESMGVTSMNNLKKKQFGKLDEWFSKGQSVSVNYPDETRELLERIISRHAGESLNNSTFEQESKLLSRILGQGKYAA